MSPRLPVFFVLLLSGLLLAAAGAQGASAEPLATTSALEEDFEGIEDEREEGGEEEVEAACEAQVEFELGEIDEVETEEICEENAEASPAVRPKQGKATRNGGRRGQRHKKACSKRGVKGKRRCSQRSHRHRTPGRS